MSAISSISHAALRVSLIVSWLCSCRYFVQALHRPRGYAAQLAACSTPPLDPLIGGGGRAGRRRFAPPRLVLRSPLGIASLLAGFLRPPLPPGPRHSAAACPQAYELLTRFPHPERPLASDIRGTRALCPLPCTLYPKFACFAFPYGFLPLATPTFLYPLTRYV